jgi:GR25 family glycosyltransferase involved in LPS biosynthesis
MDPIDILMFVIIVILIAIIGYHWYYRNYESPNFFIVDEKMRKKYRGHTPKFHFDQTITYFINLDRAKERKENLLKQCQKQGLEAVRFPAIDGRIINIDDPQYTPHMKHMRWWYKKDPAHIGHFACYLSHLSIYKKFLESKHEYCLIFEDDVEFVTESFKADLMKHMRHIPEDWDIVLLGYHIDDRDTRVKNGNRETRLVNNILNITYFTGTHGYIVNRRSAEILFRELQEHEWVIDWNISFLAERGLLNIYGVFTPLVCQPAVYDIKVNGLSYHQNCRRDMGGMKTSVGL